MSQVSLVFCTQRLATVLCLFYGRDCSIPRYSGQWILLLTVQFPFPFFSSNFSDEACTSGQLVVASRESQYKIFHFHHGGLDKLSEVFQQWKYCTETHLKDQVSCKVQQRPQQLPWSVSPVHGVYLSSWGWNGMKFEWWASFLMMITLASKHWCTCLGSLSWTEDNSELLYSLIRLDGNRDRRYSHLIPRWSLKGASLHRVWQCRHKRTSREKLHSRKQRSCSQAGISNVECLLGNIVGSLLAFITTLVDKIWAWLHVLQLFILWTFLKGKSYWFL